MKLWAAALLPACSRQLVCRRRHPQNPLRALKSTERDQIRWPLQSSVPEVCSNLQFISGAERPDIANGVLSYMTPYARHDAGEVNYSCTHNGKPARAYMLAATYMYSVLWGQSLLVECVAPADPP